jgi:hypothetical protein
LRKYNGIEQARYQVNDRIMTGRSVPQKQVQDQSRCEQEAIAIIGAGAGATSTESRYLFPSITLSTEENPIAQRVISPAELVTTLMNSWNRAEWQRRRATGKDGAKNV